MAVLHLVLPDQVGLLTEKFADYEHQKPVDPGLIWPVVLWAVSFLIVSQIIIAGLSFVSTRFKNHSRERLIYDVTMQMYNRVVRFDPEFFRNHDAEEINTRTLEDAKVVADFELDWVVQFPVVIATLLIYGAYMFYVNWFFAVWLIPLCLLSGYFLLFDKRIQKDNRRSRRAWDRVRGQAREYLAGVEEIRPNSAFAYGRRLMDRSFSAYQDVVKDISGLSNAFKAASPIISAIQDGSLYLIGASLCILALAHGTASDDGMTWGKVIAFTIVAAYFKESVSELAGLILDWRMAKANIDRVQEFQEQQVLFPESEDHGEFLNQGKNIGFKGVEVVGDSGARILNQVTLEIAEGQHVAFVGPAGCGKSTAIRLLSKGNRAAAGQVLLRDMKLEEVTLGSLAREIGVVQQNPFLLNSTVRNNLLLSLRRPAKKILHDQSGEIDIEPLSDVKDEEGLNRELIRVVQAVGLELDVLRKALDVPVPEGDKIAELLQKLTPLQAAIKQTLAGKPDAAVIRFDREAYLMQGTLRENLLFGLAANKKKAFEVSEIAVELKACLNEAGLWETLLKIGKRRIHSDQRLATALVQRSPELEQLLNLSEDDVSAETSLTSRQINGNPDSKFEDALLKAALDADARWLVEASKIPNFENRVVAARKSLWQQVEKKSGPVEDFATLGRVQGLTLREILLQGRVDESVFQAADKVDTIIAECLKSTGMLQGVLVMGLEYPVGENGKFLSGGQRQKVAIGRALLKRPRMLLLDEATAALDELSQRRIVELIENEYRGKTVVSITHRLSTIKDCDRIFVFDRGAVVQQGTYGELSAQSGLFHILLSQQHGVEPVLKTESTNTAATSASELELHHQLAQCALFASLKADQIEILTRVAQVVRCEPGTILFQRGDPGNDLFVVLEGGVEFFVEQKNAAGETTLVVENTAKPGEAFGEIAVFSGEARTLGARTVGSTRLCVLPKEKLLSLLEDAHLAQAFLELLAHRFAAHCRRQYAKTDAQTSVT
ncbi:MAG: ATP-binding cassette domain-containing protein [Verrucomicrobiota bacterium]